MGLGGISIWQLVIILVIVMLLFGTSRLRGLGNDLGAAIKGFRSSVSSDEEEEKKADDSEANATAAADDAATSQLKEQDSKS